MKFLKFLAYLFQAFPAIIILICGIAGLYVSYNKLYPISYGAGGILVGIFILFVVGIYLEKVSSKREEPQQSQEYYANPN